jgi:hypothetical protein
MPSSKDPRINRQKAREYAREHPEWKRESNKQYMRRKRTRLGPAYNVAIGLRAKRKDPLRYLLNHAKKRAEPKGVPFALTPEDVTMPEVCPVFGTAWEWGVGVKGWRNMRAPSLDRIDPALGYVPGNVVVISMRANHLKSNGSLGELRAVVEWMERVGAPEDRTETPYTPWWDTGEPSPQLSLAL